MGVGADGAIGAEAVDEGARGADDPRDDDGAWPLEPELQASANANTNSTGTT